MWIFVLSATLACLFVRSKKNSHSTESEQNKLKFEGEQERRILQPLNCRIARLQEAIPMIKSVLEDETNLVTIQATLSCLLWETLTQTNWCGFYQVIPEQPRILKVGPYQGTLGCLTISYDRGVCGTCARTEEIVLVPDVHQFRDHIACDSRTNSELVIPIKNSDGVLLAVLDLDSTFSNGFSQEEASLLKSLLDTIFSHVSF